MTFNLSLLGVIEKGLWGCALASLIYIFASFSHQHEGVPALKALKDNNAPSLAGPVVPDEPLLADDILGKLKKRDIFGVAQKDNILIPNLGALGNDLPSQLKVVAVIIGSPSQIVIEDSADKNTYFVEEGKSDGPFELKSVSNHKIRLNYQGQLIELPVNN